jgi:hypothetical protein
MFDITTYRSGEVVARAEADDPENAMFAGQILFDEAIALFPCYGAGRAITTAFHKDGGHVATVAGRRPV